MARIAASEARRRKREQALPHGTPEVFVVRRPGTSLQFCWEIRRFGGVVIGRGTVGYGTPDAARSAGREAPGPIGDRGMTIGGPAPRGGEAARPEVPPCTVARQELRGRISRLCEAALWSMARRRVP